jgi:hypothetical protein
MQNSTVFNVVAQIGGADILQIFRREGVYTMVSILVRAQCPIFV